MPRKGPVSKREIVPDPMYGDLLLAKFVNSVMRCGKKSTAERIVYTTLKVIADQTKDDPLKIFKKAIDNTRPLVEVRSRRVGGANYQVPIEVRASRGVSLAMRWIIGNAQGRAGKSMIEKLSQEVLDASNNRGGAIKKKEDVHRMAEANKAFAHYRW